MSVAKCTAADTVDGADCAAADASSAHAKAPANLEAFVLVMMFMDQSSQINCRWIASGVYIVPDEVPASERLRSSA